MSVLRHRFRPDYTQDLYPYVPPHITRPKECLRIYLVHLPDRFLFEIPRNLKLMAVPLFELNDNRNRYGAVIAALPEQLSRFAFHYAQVGSLSAGPAHGDTRSASDLISFADDGRPLPTYRWRNNGMQESVRELEAWAASSCCLAALPAHRERGPTSW